MKLLCLLLRHRWLPILQGRLCLRCGQWQTDKWFC